MQLWYALAKTLSEQAAWALAVDRMLNMVSINAGLVLGPAVALQNLDPLSHTLKVERAIILFFMLINIIYFYCAFFFFFYIIKLSLYFFSLIFNSSHRSGSDVRKWSISICGCEFSS